MHKVALDPASDESGDRESAKADRDAAALFLHTAAMLREEAACDRNLAALFRHQAALDRRVIAESPRQGQPRNGSAHPTNELGKVVGLLQQTAEAVDELWNEARNLNDGQVRMALAEASHGVHRALIALGDDRKLR
jgi:hypothetical protein